MEMHGATFKCPEKAAIFRIQNAIKTFMNGITRNLVHMFLVALIVDIIRFFENL